jgi:hypothetical protein
MHLDGNAAALAAYLAGDRRSPPVTEYFERCEVALPGSRTKVYGSEKPRYRK